MPVADRPREHTGRNRAKRGGAGAAVGYLRRSTDRQEQSIPDQRKAIEKWADEQGISLLRFYTDDAISGTSSVGRKAFQQLMADAQKASCEFSTVVVYDVKRFGRVGNDEAGYYRHLLRQAGVEVRYVSENFAGDGTDDLLRPVKQWQAREESKDLAKVTIRGLLSKSTRGHWMGGAPPFGYDLRYESQSGQVLFTLRYMPDGSKRMLSESGELVRTLERGESVAVSRRDHCVLLPSEPGRVDIVKGIFKAYVEDGRGYKSVAAELNAKGVPAPRGPVWSPTYSGLWAMTTVRAILVNPAYAGDIAWNRRTDARFFRISTGGGLEAREALGRRLEPNPEDDWIIAKDAHEPLVDRGVWDAAQERLRNHPRGQSQRGVNPRTGLLVNNKRPIPLGTTGPRAKFLLSGLCVCSRCGARYEGYTQRRKQRGEGGELSKRFTYACGASIRRGRSVCSLGEVPKDDLERVVIDAAAAFYKERYGGKGGAQRLGEAAAGGVVLRRDEAKKLRAHAERDLARIDGAIRTLLDNLTARNREHVDRRIAALEAGRQEAQDRVERIARQALDERETRRVAESAAEFLATLPHRLTNGPLERRVAAVRRCVRRVVVDSEKRTADIEMWTVPAESGRCEAREWEAVRVETLEAKARCRKKRSTDE